MFKNSSNSRQTVYFGLTRSLKVDFYLASILKAPTQAILSHCHYYCKDWS